MVRAMLALLWTLIVLYPDPRLLITSIARAWNPVIEPSGVRELAAGLPDDPRAIETIVTTELIAYATPWQTYGVPWYFPPGPDLNRQAHESTILAPPVDIDLVLGARTDQIRAAPRRLRATIVPPALG